MYRWLFILLLLSVDAGASGGSRSAVCFLGTGTGQADRVKIPLDPHSPVDVGGDFTIEFWMKARAVENNGIVSPGQNGDGWITGNVIVDRDIYGGGDYGDFGIAMGRSGGGGVLAFGTHNGNYGETIVGSSNVADDAWHHVAVTRSEGGLMQLFVDGVLDAEAAGPPGELSYRDGRSTSWPQSDPYLVLGAEKHDAGAEYPSFTGCLDEFRVWSRVLEVSDLARVAGSVVDPSREQGLVGYYRFEEGQGTNVADSAAVAPVGQLIAGVPGNGEWQLLQSGGETAPVKPAVPVLMWTPAGDMSFFAQWNFIYEIASTTGLVSAGWMPVTSLTNLAGPDTTVLITNLSYNANSGVFRVQGIPLP